MRGRNTQSQRSSGLAVSQRPTHGPIDMDPPRPADPRVIPACATKSCALSTRWPRVYFEPHRRQHDRPDLLRNLHTLRAPPPASAPSASPNSPRVAEDGTARRQARSIPSGSTTSTWRSQEVSGLHRRSGSAPKRARMSLREGLLAGAGGAAICAPRMPKITYIEADGTRHRDRGRERLDRDGNRHHERRAGDHRRMRRRLHLRDLPRLCR